jgi:formate hydrogenlyase subunit 6/NADH:ubiquinone oxidoreductase subunit I
MQCNAADGLFTKSSTLDTRKNYCGLQASQITTKTRKEQMFKLHLISELKEAFITLKDKTLTIPKSGKTTHPLPSPQQKMMIYDKKCIGCGACATVCPALAISLTENKKHRTVTMTVANCIYCGLCITICPENALSLGAGDELSSLTKDHLHHELKIKLTRCEHCRTTTGTHKSITKVIKNLFAPHGVTTRELEWINLCAACKRKFHSSRLTRQMVK